jgi:hypothetical protein
VTQTDHIVANWSVSSAAACALFVLVHCGAKQYTHLFWCCLATGRRSMRWLTAPGTSAAHPLRPSCSSEYTAAAQLATTLVSAPKHSSTTYNCCNSTPLSTPACSPLLHRPTMMFQIRSFTFTLSNPSLTALSYQWQILDKAGNPDTSGECCVGSNKAPATPPALKFRERASHCCVEREQ